MPATTPNLVTGAFHGGTVAEQNDRFRTTLGTDPTVPGHILVTAGVDALGPVSWAQIMVAVQAFSTFTEDNDPFGTRDFGTFTVTDGRHAVPLYWKIDLYDLAYEFGSDAPDDPTRTRRVLTILLPEEW